MVTIPELWLPIVLATVLCFVMGYVLYMVLPLHRRDWEPLPEEEGVLAKLRDVGTKPGHYMFPCPADPKHFASAEFTARLERGPVGVMMVRPSGKVTMAPNLVKMLAYHLVISVFVAYLAGRVLIQPELAYLEVFRVAGTVGVLGYVGAIFPHAIWYGGSTRYLVNQVVDGLVWGLVTAGSFAGFWPR